MTASIDIWSDIHCPWALIAVHRLRDAREKHGLDVIFAPRAWPLEWVNRRGTPRDIVTTETAALASHEPSLFNAYTAGSWPSTFLPAFELVAAARHTHGLRVAEDVDYALRLAFFRDSIDVSIQAGLRDALDIAHQLNAEVRPDDVLDAWLHTTTRQLWRRTSRPAEPCPSRAAHRSSGRTDPPRTTPACPTTAGTAASSVSDIPNPANLSDFCSPPWAGLREVGR